MMLRAVVFFKCIQQHKEKWNVGDIYEMEIGNVSFSNLCFSSFRRSNGVKPVYRRGSQQPPGFHMNRSTATGLREVIIHLYSTLVRQYLIKLDVV